MAPAPDRSWFEGLPGVVTDTAEMSALFGSERFQAAGFSVKPRISGTFAEIHDGLDKTLDALGQSACDACVVLWSGHGECLPTGELRLACRGDQTPMQDGRGYSPSELAKQLVGTNCQAVYLILDVCHAEAGAPGIYRAFAGVWNVSAPRPRGLAILCAAGTASRARDAGVVPILTRLLKEGPSEGAKKIFAEEGGGYWSTQDARLAPSQLNSAARAEALAAHLAEPFPFSAGEFRLFPNPLYAGDRPPRLAEQARLAFLSADADTHFLPNARGLDPAEPGWFFSGRVAINRLIIDHLSKPGAGRLLVLTGEGGTGKSAILGRLTILSDRTAASKAGWTEASDAQDGTVPPPGWVNAAVHLRGLTARQGVQHLGDILLGQEGAADGFDVDRLLKGIGASEIKQPLVILDALDESLEPARISNDLILPLVRANWRVLVGTRRAASVHGETDLLRQFEKLEGAYRLEDLTEQASTPADIAAYVEGRLVQSPHSPYYQRAVADSDVQRIADTVSRKASGVFLYARITADSLVRRDAPLELTPGWEDRYLGTRLDGAFAKDLGEFDRKFGEKFGKEEGFAQVNDGATKLMRALAWGRGEGLPLWDEIWPRMANAIAEPHRRYGREHAQWLLFEAGRYIVETGESEQAVYRLFHQSLNDFFHGESDAAQIESRLFDELSDIARANRNPNPYIRRHLAAHADAAKRLREVFADTWLLVLCEPFARYCPPDAFPYLDGVVQVYRAVAHRLSSDPMFNAAHILLGARLYGNEGLVHQVRSLGLPLPFTAGWCEYVPPYPESTVFQDSLVASSHRGAWHPSGDLVAVADLRGVRLFHPEDGTPASKRIELDLNNLVDIDWKMVDGRPLLAVAAASSGDSPSHLWLIGEDQIPHELLLPAAATVNGLAWGRVQDRDLLAIAADDGIWTYAPSQDRFTQMEALDIGEPAAICYGRRHGQGAFLVLATNGVFSWDGASIDFIARLGSDRGSGFSRPRIFWTRGEERDVIAVLLGGVLGCEPRLIDPATGVSTPLTIDGFLEESQQLKAMAAFQGPSGDSFLALGRADDGLAALCNLRTGENKVLDAHEYPIDDFSVHESQDETAVITAGDRVRRWLLKGMKAPSTPLKYQGTRAVAIGLSGQSEVCATFAETLRMIEPHTGQIFANALAPGSGASLQSLTFGKMDRNVILAATTGNGPPSGTCDVFQASDLQPIATFEGDHLELARQLSAAGIALDPGAHIGDCVLGVIGDELVLLCPMNSYLGVFGIESGKEAYRTAEQGLNKVREVAWTSWNGQPLIATAGIDGPIQLWNLPPRGRPTGTLVEAMPPFLGHQAAIWQLSFGLVDRRVILASGGMESPRIWDLATRQSLVLEIDNRVRGLALSNSGLLVIGTERGLITVQLSTAWVQDGAA